MAKPEKTPHQVPVNTLARLRSLAHWLIFYAVLWLLLAEGSGWYLGAFLVPAAAALTVRLGLRIPRLQWRHLPAFLWFFGREVAVGGWDVARRAFSPRVSVSPRWTYYTFAAHRPRVRLAVSACIGLMPGTLSSGVLGDRMTVHVLDDQRDWQTAIHRLETHLDQLFPGAQT
ncbi:Na+/H+ antiporter subunit E [Salinispirillum sp. LH 10-3-1]|uniref:Na+/H+ antiporter subunit E n=1 Tax=Salinispirillum sp. LH 10-3-1 TaxID=2952525 RepID=A0AB38YE49_9GAMM